MTVGFPRDRHHAAINGGREGPVLTSISASQAALAFRFGWNSLGTQSARALDLDGAVAGQKYRRGMGIDTLNRRAAMTCGSPRKSMTACCEVSADFIMSLFCL